MPATAPSPKNTQDTRRVPGNGLWARISEGRAVGDLWSQFSADAQASYGFYGKDLDWEKINELSGWKRPFHVAKHFFWALVMKMTPARRGLPFLGAVLLILFRPKFYFCPSFCFDLKREGLGAGCFFV